MKIASNDVLMVNEKQSCERNQQPPTLVDVGSAVVSPLSNQSNNKAAKRNEFISTAGNFTGISVILNIIPF